MPRVTRSVVTLPETTRRWQSRSGLRKTSLDAVDIAQTNASPPRYVAAAMLCLGDMTVARANCDSRSRACGGVIICPPGDPPATPPPGGGPGPGPGRGGEIRKFRKFRKIRKFPPRGAPAPGRQNGPKIGPKIGPKSGPKRGSVGAPSKLNTILLAPQNGPRIGCILGRPGAPPGGGAPGAQKVHIFLGI